MDKVVHFEIPTKNKEKAKEFYSKIFGWKFIDIPDMKYTMVHTANTDDKGMIQEMGAINGGMTVDDPVSGPVLVIDVDNVEEYAKKIKEAGCEIVMPTMKVGDMGMYARFKDTEGNVLGIWQTLKKE